MQYTGTQMYNTKMYYTLNTHPILWRPLRKLGMWGLSEENPEVTGQKLGAAVWGDTCPWGSAQVAPLVKLGKNVVVDKTCQLAQENPVSHYRNAIGLQAEDQSSL